MRTTISRAELFAFCRTLGADPMQTRDIRIFGDRIEVTTYHLDENGARHLVNPPGFRKEGDPPDEVATETTVIEIYGGSDDKTVRLRHPNLPGRVIDAPASAVGHHVVAGWEVATDERDESAPAAPAEPEPDKQPEAPAPGEETPRGRRKSKESG
jgi:hypothetical protein